MTNTSRLKKLPLVFRRLTGIAPEKFDEILIQLTRLYTIWNLKRLSHVDCKRKIGGGHPFCLHLEDRLLMLLMYYRTYTTHMFLGFLCFCQTETGSPALCVKEGLTGCA